MIEVPPSLLRQFTDACHRVADEGLVRCSSGNLSWRIDDKHMLVSASRTWLQNITEEGVAVCRIEDASVINDRTPTVEVRFHSGILRERPEANVVLHFQTPCATTFACMERQPNFFVTPEVPYYIGDIGYVSYFKPGSMELAAAVTDAMRTHNLILMRNHGGVTAGKDFNEVIQNAAFFELACEILIRGGHNVQPLTEDAVRDLNA